MSLLLVCINAERLKMSCSLVCSSGKPFFSCETRLRNLQEAASEQYISVSEGLGRLIHST